MLQLFLSGIIKPLAFPLYCCGMWTLAGLFLWSIWKAGKDGVAQLRRLHQVPCTHCAFFTGDYRLKCTVHPIKALTEEAISCIDYEPTTNRTTVYRKRCKCLGSFQRYRHQQDSTKRSYLKVNSLSVARKCRYGEL